MIAGTARSIAPVGRYLIPAVIALLAVGLLRTSDSQASVTPLYTLPFTGSFSIACGFHCYYDATYGWHEGTDYEVGQPGVGGEQIVAAAGGTAKPCPEDPGAGNYVVIDHGNGNRTRYLHFNNQSLLADRTVVRGEIIGYEGNLGYTVPPGFYHLHFETRIDAQGAATCGKDGTAVDPYATGGYLWTTNPPSLGPCITPTSPYRDGSLYREENGNGQVFVVYGQTKYYIPNPDIFEAMVFSWSAIQCVTYGSLGAISNVPYDKTLFMDWGGAAIYLAECSAKFWVPDMDTLDTMVANGWANLPVYAIPTGDSALISDVPFNGCRMQEYGGATLWLTCPDPSRKWGMTAYAWTIFSQIDSNVRIVWPGALDSMTMLDHASLKTCPDSDNDPWSQHWSDLSEQFMGTDPNARCASDTTRNDEPPPDHWPADFNDDQQVNVLDISGFSSKFNSSAPGPPYDPRYDLNQDDAINVLDMSPFSSLLNKSCAP